MARLCQRAQGDRRTCTPGVTPGRLAASHPCGSEVQESGAERNGAGLGSLRAHRRAHLAANGELQGAACPGLFPDLSAVRPPTGTQNPRSTGPPHSRPPLFDEGQPVLRRDAFATIRMDFKALLTACGSSPGGSPGGYRGKGGGEQVFDARNIGIMEIRVIHTNLVSSIGQLVCDIICSEKGR